MATDGGEGSSSASQLAEVLSAVRRVETNSQLRRKLKDERDECLVKKIRLEKQPSLKKPGHERQFKEVCDKLDSADAALAQHPPAVEKARTLLQEGQKIIDTCQKLNKIADRSEHGWATVKEYKEDELAENSDDKKRLFRAEPRAGRKTRQKSTKSSNACKKGQFPSAGSKAAGAFMSRSPVGGVAEIALLQNLLLPMQAAKHSLPVSGSPN